jgi:hypothetical protein
MNLDHSNTGIVGSNLVRGTDVCRRHSLLCCLASVEALRWNEPPSKLMYQNV